ncbi:unnamed protein product [Rotaria sp. Silwood1]|nr:unnamed protein product [Rotaria sp. Silwood1]
MASKYVNNESKHTQRFADIPGEPRRMLGPIQGYEKMPLVSLEQAVEPLVSYVPDVKRMVWTVKQNCGSPADANAQWVPNGVTVAGGREAGNTTDRLSKPYSLFITNDQTVVIADTDNHRIIQWKIGDPNGQVVAGGHGCIMSTNSVKWMPKCIGPGQPKR